MRLASGSLLLFGAASFGGLSLPAMIPAIAAACTPALPTVTPYPVDGATQVPVNSGVLFSHRSAVIDASTVQVTANSQPVAGSFQPLASEKLLWPAWTLFTPTAQLPVGATVVVTLDTQYLLATSQTAFQVGGSADNDPPTGGGVLSAVPVEGDTAGAWGYTATFEGASDLEGPAWIHATVTETDDSGIDTYDRVVDGTSWGIDGGSASCSTAMGEGDVTITSYAFDLAGNRGPEKTFSFHVGPDDSGPICEVGLRGSPWATLVLLAGAAMASRRRGRRVSQACDRPARSGSSGDS
jgi:hypothetical protein